MAEYFPPIPIPNDRPNFEYKVIYAVARIGWNRRVSRFCSICSLPISDRIFYWICP
jgi:hypothetical protein